MENDNNNSVIDDETMAQIGFLRADYEDALETIKQQACDIRRLLAILVEKGLPVPNDIVERYVEKTYDEELPFQ